MAEKNRVRVRKSKNKTPAEEHSKELQGLLDRYAETDDKMKALATTQQNALGQIENLMNKTGLRYFDTVRAEANVAPGVSRSTTVVDPVAFKAAVSKADFMESITIPIGKAKKVLSERELKKCSDVKPGAKKPDVLKVTVKPKPAE
ncbi:MAG: hypothetical protein KAJ73_00505 [Zetaproteobacteria bacterium]|nr:hypothetical protein [Zetaproteobacteria bacterium]